MGRSIIQFSRHELVKLVEIRTCFPDSQQAGGAGNTWAKHEEISRSDEAVSGRISYWASNPAVGVLLHLYHKPILKVPLQPSHTAPSEPNFTVIFQSCLGCLRDLATRSLVDEVHFVDIPPLRISIHLLPRPSSYISICWLNCLRLNYLLSHCWPEPSSDTLLVLTTLFWDVLLYICRDG